MPFYPTLCGEGLNFHNTLLRIVLTQYADSRFDGGFYDIERLCLRDHDETDFARVTL
jgi:hypothetical protein